MRPGLVVLLLVLLFWQLLLRVLLPLLRVGRSQASRRRAVLRRERRCAVRLQTRHRTQAFAEGIAPPPLWMVARIK